jgi:hypothetical protein
MLESAGRARKTQRCRDYTARRALLISRGARKATETEPHHKADVREGSPIGDCGPCGKSGVNRRACLLHFKSESGCLALERDTLVLLPDPVGDVAWLNDFY